MVGELVSLSQQFKTNKRFISALIRRRRGTSLPVELDLSLGMRRYLVILTEDKGVQPTYKLELGHFVLPDRSVDRESDIPLRRSTHEINPMEKGKRPDGMPSLKAAKKLVESSSHLVDAERPDPREMLQPAHKNHGPR